MIEAANDPATMRVKLEMPVAEGSRSGGMRSSEMVSMARKKVLIAMPWTSSGTIRSPKLAYVV